MQTLTVQQIIHDTVMAGVEVSAWLCETALSLVAVRQVRATCQPMDSQPAGRRRGNAQPSVNRSQLVHTRHDGLA